MIRVTGRVFPFFPGGCFFFFFSPLRRKRKSFGSEGNFQIEIRRGVGFGGFFQGFPGTSF